MSPTERNKAVIRKLLEAADRGDLDAVAACYAPDYRDHAEGGSRPTGDLGGALDTFRELRGAFPRARHVIEDLIAEEDRVVLRVTATGLHEGELRGHAASGRIIEMRQTVVYRMRDGLIAERWLDGAQSVEALLTEGGAPATAPRRNGSEHPKCVHAADAPWRADVWGASYWELPLRDVSLTCFRLAPGTRFPEHAHDAEQITMVLEGWLTFEVGEETHQLGPGDAIAVPAGVAHAVSAGATPVVAIDAWSPPPVHLGCP